MSWRLVQGPPRLSTEGEIVWRLRILHAGLLYLTRLWDSLVVVLSFKERQRNVFNVGRSGANLEWTKFL